MSSALVVKWCCCAPRDNPARIDYPKLTRMAQWIYLTGWFVANTPERPKLDPGFRLER